MINFSNNNSTNLINWLKKYFKFTYLVRSNNIFLENDLIKYVNQKKYNYENIIFSKKLLI